MGDQVAQKGVSFVHQFCTVLLHALVDFIKKVEMLFWGYKLKNRLGSAISLFPPFLHLGVRIRLSIGKLNPQTSIAIVEDVFQNRQSVVD